MSLPQVIQGGVGVGVSGWRLARAVSMQNQSEVVSGTGINSIMIRRLQDGDEGGHVRRALAHFPDQKVATKILSQYFIPGGRTDGQRYKRCATPSVQPSRFLNQLNVVGSFVEVWLVKEGHDWLVGINFLEKIQVALLPGTYGAMLAGVDYVLVGAGALSRNDFLDDLGDSFDKEGDWSGRWLRHRGLDGRWSQRSSARSFAIGRDGTTGIPQ